MSENLGVLVLFSFLFRVNYDRARPLPHLWPKKCINIQFEGTLHQELYIIECFRGGTEGGAILLHFDCSPDPFLMQQNEPFLPYTLELAPP